MTSPSLALGAAAEAPREAETPDADRLAAVARSAACAPAAGDLVSLAALAAARPAPHLV
jgi:hypothetical protein